MDTELYIERSTNISEKAIMASACDVEYPDSPEHGIRKSKEKCSSKKKKKTHKSNSKPKNHTEKAASLNLDFIFTQKSSKKDSIRDFDEEDDYNSVISHAYDCDIDESPLQPTSEKKRETCRVKKRVHHMKGKLPQYPCVEETENGENMAGDENVTEQQIASDDYEYGVQDSIVQLACEKKPRKSVGEHADNREKSSGSSNDVLQTKTKNVDKVLQSEEKSCASTDVSSKRAVRKKKKKSSKSSREAKSKKSGSSPDPVVKKLEKKLFSWIKRKAKNKSNSLNDKTLKRRSLHVYKFLTKDMDSPKSFSASSEWLERFKNKFRVSSSMLLKPDVQNKFDLKKEPVEPAEVNDESAAFKFAARFMDLTKMNGYQGEQVFVAVESSLFYKRMAHSTFFGKSLEKSLCPEIRNAYVRLLLCANATGNFKCKPLLIFHSENAQDPDILDKKNLPVHLRFSNEARSTANVIWEWFHNLFIPEVDEYLQHENLYFKILLVLDTSYKGLLECAHPNIQVTYLPSRESSPCKTLDRELIRTFRSYYLHNVCKSISEDLTRDGTVGKGENYLDKYGLCNVIDSVHATWAEMPAAAINVCWRSVWPTVVHYHHDFPCVKSIRKQICDLVKKINCGESCEVDGEVIGSITELNIEELIDDPLNLPVKKEKGIRPSTEEFPCLKISELLKKVHDICNEIVAVDPVLDRSITLKRTVENAVLPYRLQLNGYVSDAVQNAHSNSQVEKSEPTDNSCATSSLNLCTKSKSCRKKHKRSGKKNGSQKKKKKRKKERRKEKKL